VNPAINKPMALNKLRVILSHTSHPGNIGAAARAMKTMGISSLYLVNPKYFPDPQATAMASGAGDLLEAARVCASLDEALAGATLAVAITARSRDLSQQIRTLRQAAPEIVEASRQQEVALVFGTEMSGLTTDEISRCQLLVTIPANPEYSSLNLAAAVQVVGYELRATAGDIPHTRNKQQELADLEDVERFYRHLEEVLVEIRFLDPKHPKRLMERLRRLFGRTRLEKEEVNILRGILTAVKNS
jgi:tRNA/rRNA methyltransferase